MSQIDDATIRVATLLLTISLLMAGCSSSSDSTALTEENNALSQVESNITSTQADANVISIEDEESNSDEVGESIVSTDEEGMGDVADESNGAAADDAQANTTSDQLISNVTRVDFQITVPAYQSNALRVRITWGDNQADATWVGDELWSSSLELPSNTERLLTIVFSDDNGNIELGSYEEIYGTGFNDAELVQIMSDQFDTDRWDFDEDGISNLDELITGTDPLVDEESLLPIIDSQPMSLLFVANYYEDKLPGERPFMGTQEDIEHEMYSGTSTTADIDENGNGSLFVNTLPTIYNNNRSGERIVLENSVQWSGSWNYSDDFWLNQTFNSEITVEGDTRRLAEQGSGSWVGTYHHGWVTTVDVTGHLIEGTSFCKVVSGTITERYNNNYNGRRATTLTITRESADDFWRVSKVDDRDGEIATSEYFARELSMHMIRFGYQNKVSKNDYFFCDFTDLR